MASAGSGAVKDVTNVRCTGGSGNVLKLTRVITASVPSEPIISLWMS
jgi:hypothetical protein